MEASPGGGPCGDGGWPHCTGSPLVSGNSADRPAVVGRRRPPHGPPSTSDVVGAPPVAANRSGRRALGDGITVRRPRPTWRVPQLWLPMVGHPCCTPSATPNRQNGVEGGAGEVPAAADRPSSSNQPPRAGNPPARRPLATVRVGGCRRCRCTCSLSFFQDTCSSQAHHTGGKGCGEETVHVAGVAERRCAPSRFFPTLPRRIHGAADSSVGRFTGKPKGG